MSRPQPQTADLFAQLDREIWFVDRMEQLGAADVMGLLSGVTDQATRRARIREKVISNGLRTVIIGGRNGKAETFEQCFERLFGEPLNPEGKRRRQAADHLPPKRRKDSAT